MPPSQMMTVSQLRWRARGSSGTLELTYLLHTAARLILRRIIAYCTLYHWKPVVCTRLAMRDEACLAPPVRNLYFSPTCKASLPQHFEVMLANHMLQITPRHCLLGPTCAFILTANIKYVKPRR